MIGDTVYIDNDYSWTDFVVVNELDEEMVYIEGLLHGRYYGQVIAKSRLLPAFTPKEYAERRAEFEADISKRLRSLEASPWGLRR